MMNGIVEDAMPTLQLIHLYIGAGEYVYAHKHHLKIFAQYVYIENVNFQNCMEFHVEHFIMHIPYFHSISY